MFSGKDRDLCKAEHNAEVSLHSTLFPVFIRLGQYLITPNMLGKHPESFRRQSSEIFFNSRFLLGLGLDFYF